MAEKVYCNIVDRGMTGWTIDVRQGDREWSIVAKIGSLDEAHRVLDAFLRRCIPGAPVVRRIR